MEKEGLLTDTAVLLFILSLYFLNYFFHTEREQGYLTERPASHSYIITKVSNIITLYLSNISEFHAIFLMSQEILLNI